MEPIILVNTVIRFIESRIQSNIDYDEMEKATGFSYRHIREVFKTYTNIPLKHYIDQRKAAHIAFDIENSARSLTDLAADYGFEAYDSFTRLFKRETGLLPSAYRKKGIRNAQRRLIAMGTYGPVLPYHKQPDIELLQTSLSKTILYGVPKIAFNTGKCTPLYACMESMLHYIGQYEHASYAYLASAGAGTFRLCFNAGKWDMSNPDISNMTPQDRWLPYRRAYRAAGWHCTITEKKDTDKAGFFSTITSSIDQGIPVITVGIVGPEAAIVTGYNRQGAHLYGFSFFQDMPEFTADVSIDTTGYFITDTWWETAAAVITLKEKVPATSIKDTLQLIYDTLTANAKGTYRTGQKAYESWAADLADDRFFASNTITPVLLQRLFCQADAETMVGEGRYWGAAFFTQLGIENPALSTLCNQAATLLTKTAQCAMEMTAVRHGESATEDAVHYLCYIDIRQRLIKLIRQAKDYERQASTVIQKIIQLY